jgi:hypothetical protein
MNSLTNLIERYNPDSRPFKWRKREVKGAQIKDTMVSMGRCELGDAISEGNEKWGLLLGVDLRVH